MTVAAPVPADSTGRYPNLAGFAPIATDRRAAVVCVDALLAVVAYGAATAVAYFAQGSAVGTAVPVAIVVIYYGFSLWALFGRSARLAGVLMKAQFVRVETGRNAPGRVILAYLLTSLLGTVTLWIAPLIIFFASIQKPFNRNWFDRITGLMLIDMRHGRRPSDPLPEQAPYSPPPAVAPVQFPGADAHAWSPAASGGGFASPHAADAMAQPPAASGVPDWRAPQADPSRQPVNPVTEASGLITTTPRGPSASRAPAAPPPSFAPPVVVREMRSVDAAQPDKTQLSADSALAGAAPAAPHAVLGDGRVLSLTPPAALGRNPQAPGSHPDAVPLAIGDQLASKTHLLLGSDAEGAWVIDLHSTNGVWVARAAADTPGKIPPGRKVHLPAGARVRFGGQTVTIR